MGMGMHQGSPLYLNCTNVRGNCASRPSLNVLPRATSDSLASIFCFPSSNFTLSGTQDYLSCIQSFLLCPHLPKGCEHLEDRVFFFFLHLKTQHIMQMLFFIYKKNCTRFFKGGGQTTQNLSNLQQQRFIFHSCHVSAVSLLHGFWAEGSTSSTTFS